MNQLVQAALDVFQRLSAVGQDTLATPGLPQAVLAVLAALLVGMVLAFARSRRREAQAQSDARIAAQADSQLAEIRGRLSAIAEMTAQREAEQTRSLNERMDALSRQLAQSLDGVAGRLGANVAEAGQRTSASLASLNERLAVIADARASLAALSSEVLSLSDTLADKQARGAFGQVRMETIVRDALPAGAYELQATLSNGRRPDCLVRIPNAPAIAIDAKFPLEGFEALRRARAPDEVKQASASVREAVGRHVDDIAGKYLIAGETQDTALMFVPSESVYATLHEAFPDLVQRAYRARVVIVAPNILMLAVQTIQALVKDAKMRDQAGAIQREVGAIVAEVGRLAERTAELERHFALAQKALERVSATAGRIATRGERIAAVDLGEELAEPGSPPRLVSGA